MTIVEFMNECEDAYGGKSYTSGQRSSIEAKCSRFDERELNGIYSELLESCRYLPKIADIYDAARYLGMLHADEFKPHRWIETACGFCRGEGRIAIIWHCFMEERASGLVEIQELVQVFPYSKSFDYKLGKQEYRSISRCQCTAGDALSIPQSYQKWTVTSETRRVRYV